MKSKDNVLYHIGAIVTSIIWGTTFVSSKVLITRGLTPEQIMLLRFLLAYVCMSFFAPRKLLSKTWKDEILLLILGATGGSLYFLAENTALIYTQACNVSILISLLPLLTAFITPLFYKSEHFGKSLYVGAVVALVGITFIEINGQVVLKLNPIGDILTIIAALLWVAYTLVLKQLQNNGYSSAFITRKVFFYGIITILPVFPITHTSMNWTALSDITVLFNLAFLGIIASFLCYYAWNRAIDKIGAVASSNYLYINPLATFITSAIVLHERITIVSVVGSLMILFGVYLSQTRRINVPKFSFLKKFLDK